MDDIAFPRVRDALADLLGLDLRAYKQQQMRRRIDTFISRHCGGDLDVFLSRIRADATFLQSVRDMLTINVTEFFRDPAQWSRLQEQVLPGLLKQRAGLRIWSAGCSHGQEPVSLAILLDRLGGLRRSSILATDFDHAALQRTADGGPYRPHEVANLSSEDLAKYFVAHDGGYVTVSAIRSAISTSIVNLLSDRFERDLDLVVCRNVMIYFETDVKSELIRRFQASLRPGGVLFIGATEALIGQDLQGFERLGGNFYRRAAVAGVRAA